MKAWERWLGLPELSEGQRVICYKEITHFKIGEVYTVYSSDIANYKLLPGLDFIELGKSCFHGFFQPISEIEFWTMTKLGIIERRRRLVWET